MPAQASHVISDLERRGPGVRLLTLPLVLSLMVTACHSNSRASSSSTAPPMSPTSLTVEQMEDCQHKASDWMSNPESQDPSYLPAQGADICVIQSFNAENQESTLIARYEASNKEPKWAMSLTPRIAAYGRDENDADVQSAQELAGDVLRSRAAGYATVSPNGKYLSLVLRPPEVADDSPRPARQTPAVPAEQRTTVVVLDAVSGKPVRTVEVSGLVLGQALTSDSLAVETADAYYPAGAGKGRISIFSLTEPSAPPTSFTTGLWLAGSGKSSLLLSSQPAHSHDTATTSTVTQVDLHGKHLATFTNSSEILLGGWVRRCTYLPDEDRIRWEVVDTNSGTVYNEDTDSAVARRVPTGPGLLISQVVINDKGYREAGTPRFWLSAADDGHHHTENLEQFKNN
ncbi:conserved domain protein [Actinomyces sp. oral taxon 175 str. F0384]|nr:conserved domain protein [Actinomyces sp. oral taxon 175 str. F0384]